MEPPTAPVDPRAAPTDPTVPTDDNDVFAAFPTSRTDKPEAPVPGPGHPHDGGPVGTNTNAAAVAAATTTREDGDGDGDGDVDGDQTPNPPNNQPPSHYDVNAEVAALKAEMPKLPAITLGHQAAARADQYRVSGNLLEAMKAHHEAAVRFLEASKQSSVVAVSQMLDEYARTHSLQEENARTRLTLARKDQQTSRPPLRSKFSSQRDSVSSAPSTPGVGGATSRTNSSVMDSFMVVDAHGRGAHRRTSGRRASNNTYISFDGDDAVPKQQHDAVKRELELAQKELASAQRLSEHKDRQIAAADQQLRQLQIALAQMVRPSRIGTHPSWDGTADALELHMRLESRATVEAVRRILPQLRLGDDVNDSDGPKATERPGPAPPQGMSLLTIPVRYGVDGTDETPVPSPAIQADKNNNNTDIDPARAAPVDTLAPVHPRQQACGSQHTGSAPSLPSLTAAVATPGVPAVATAAATSARPAASLSNSDLVGRKLSDSDVSVTPVTPSEFAEDLSSSVRSLLAKKHVDNSAQAEELRLRQEEYLS